MVVTFSWELPGYTGTSDPDIKAHTSSSLLAIWPMALGSVPFQCLCGFFPEAGLAFYAILGRKEMSIAQAEKAPWLTASALPSERSEHLGVLSSLVDATLGVVTDAILQMETWRKEQDDSQTQYLRFREDFL